MIRVGLTGGIGSGKTTVAHIFRSLGIPIYFSDDRAKHLMSHDVELKQGVIDAFGEAAYPEGELDRAYLASIVFKDPKKLASLNALVHPAVGRDFSAWVEGLEEASEYCLKEAAILFETGGHKEMDLNILVTAPEETRVARVMERDGVEASQVRARMERQWPDEDKLSLADHVIVNDGVEALIPQVLKVHREILRHYGAQ